MLSFTGIRAPRVSLKSRKVTIPSSGILTGFWLLLDPRRRSGRRRKGRRAAPRVIVGSPPNQHGHNPGARPQAVEDHIVAFLRHVFAVDGNQTVSHLKRALLRKKNNWSVWRNVLIGTIPFPFFFLNFCKYAHLSYLSCSAVRGHMFDVDSRLIGEAAFHNGETQALLALWNRE